MRLLFGDGTMFFQVKETPKGILSNDTLSTQSITASLDNYRDT